MTEQVAQHYGKGGLLDRILGALVQAGKDVDHLTIDDLAPVDEFHSRRRLATQELAAMLAPAIVSTVRSGASPHPEDKRRQLPPQRESPQTGPSSER